MIRSTLEPAQSQCGKMSFGDGIYDETIEGAVFDIEADKRTWLELEREVNADAGQRNVCGLPRSRQSRICESGDSNLKGDRLAVMCSPVHVPYLRRFSRLTVPY